MPVPNALLVSTTCQRFSLGTFLCCFVATMFFGVALPMNFIAVAALALLGIGGIASAFHLGKPERFFNAFSNFKSHLTQEAFITPFLGLALLVCSADGLLFGLGAFSNVALWIAALLAVLFLISTGLVYQLSSRPAWNTPLVLIIFLLTAAEVGAIATIAIALSLGDTVPAAAAVMAVAVLAFSLLCQILYVARLRTVGYGVNVFVNQSPYKSTFATWSFFGLFVPVVTLALSIAWGSAAAATIGAISALIGIVYWTVLFFKVALKVKMFPMYDVDLNVNM